MQPGARSRASPVRHGDRITDRHFGGSPTNPCAAADGRDVLVVGGGISGIGIARDLATRVPNAARGDFLREIAHWTLAPLRHVVQRRVRRDRSGRSAESSSN